MLALLAGMLLLSQSDGYALWAWLFVVPVVIAGLALAHGMAARLALPWQGLLVFYLFLIGVSAALPLLMMMLSEMGAFCSAFLCSARIVEKALRVACSSMSMLTEA